MDLLEKFQSQAFERTRSDIYDSVEAAQIAFDQGLEETMILKDDTAFTIIRESMNYMFNNGEFTRLQQMAMVIGAAACTHNHMAQLSMETTALYTDGLFNNGTRSTEDKHDHSIDHADDSEDDKRDKKKKKKKGWLWLR